MKLDIAQLHQKQIVPALVLLVINMELVDKNRPFLFILKAHVCIILETDSLCDHLMLSAGKVGAPLTTSTRVLEATHCARTSCLTYTRACRYVSTSRDCTVCIQCACALVSAWFLRRLARNNRGDFVAVIPEHTCIAALNIRLNVIEVCGQGYLFLPGAGASVVTLNLQLQTSLPP